MRKEGHHSSILNDTQSLPARWTQGASWTVERQLLRLLLARMGDPRVEFSLWDGETVATAPAPRGALHLRDRRTLWRLIANPDLEFGDAYSRGTLESEGDLVKLLEEIYRAIPRQPATSLLQAFNRWRNRASSNTLTGSRSNIREHYNLGNDFFRLWLDKEMVYTCAYYASPGMTLAQAQQAKFAHICRKLRLRPGDTVVEAGCGWGALARYMARHHQVKVRAFNISHEQIAYARQRLGEDGLQGQVEFIEDDYRNITGSCDVFVSIGMLEHVGRDNYQALGRVIDRCLTAEGRGLIHTIGRDHPCPMNAWIEHRIFPGAYPPTLGEIMAVFEPFGMSVLDVENLRLHYARTLADWLARYEAVFENVRREFDGQFARAWRLYLAGSLAGFTTGWLQLFQVAFTRTGMNMVPRTRAYLYHPTGEESWTDATS